MIWSNNSWDIEQNKLIYTCVPKITIIWCTVPEIWSEIDKLFFVILGHFLPFYLSPLMIPNIKILKKFKKRLEILSFYTYMCTINEDHMVYGSWNIRWDRQKFSTFWAIFLSFQPLDKLEKTEKNTWRYYHITHLHHKLQSYVWFLRYGAQQT